VCAVCGALAACSTQYSFVSNLIQEIKSQEGFFGGDAHIPVSPNPAYRYLRVDVQGSKPALMVLAFEDPDPHGMIEVWYSASGQVIKTQLGRIVFTSGLQHNWSNVRLNFEGNNWLPSEESVVTYRRLRDEMPGYRHQIADDIKVASLSAPSSKQLPAHLPHDAVKSWKWFQEVSSGTLPVVKYAWGVHRGLATIVYSEQCLAPTYCLQLTRWPIQEGAM
jgi:hypothetical protein